MKLISFYLPQFHCIPENDKWWGEGFTEWVNIKKAKPLYDGHEQPVIPLNNNYYNLLDVETIKWQCELSKKYGLYGFCIYHYWFDGKLLLEKPMELLRDNPCIDTHYCICWANEHWTNQWVSTSEKVLIEQRYGDEKDWKKHFDYLLTFFKDSRYIKEDNKPLLVIYRPEIIPCLNDMLDYWNKLSIDCGFAGINFAYQHVGFDLLKKRDDSRFKYNIEYQPMYGMTFSKSGFKKLLSKLISPIKKIFSKKNANLFSGLRKKLRITDYDHLWQKILSSPMISEKSVPGAFVRWDNTPRKGNGGLVVKGETPTKFEKYLFAQMERAKNIYHSDKLFIFAWNEWAEGGYLEPDEMYRYQYLEAIKKAVDAFNDTDE